MKEYKLLSDEDLNKVIGGGDGYDIQTIATCLINSGATNIPGLSNLGTLYSNSNWAAIEQLLTNPSILNNPLVASCMCGEEK